MNAEQWRQIDRIFHEAIDRAPAERIRFIREACAGDPSLQEEVHALIRSHEEAGTFLEPPAAKEIPPIAATIQPGTRFGSYEVRGILGAGGMGEVYRAHDMTLKRDVALKVLPEMFAADKERLARFKREAQLLASLNHPNIAHVYGLESSADTRFIVMELVEGETLRTRIEKGAIPVAEAMAIAKEIAAAFEVAHEKGIIHRDLKPENVKITPEGKVKVLDFGLAKAHDPVSGDASPSKSPTISVAATHAGIILGTAAYMSPEQARGLGVDKRADIWAFGAVLFEMLTGNRAFVGDNVQDLLASVLAREPDWARLPASLSPVAAMYLRRCLQKDPKQRIQDIGDMRLALEGVFETPASSAPGTRLSWIIAFGVAVLGIVALTVPAYRYSRETPVSEMRIVSLTMDLAPAEMLGTSLMDAYKRPGSTAFAISPDGATIVFAGEVTLPKPTRMLYRRTLAETNAIAIPGTEGAEHPFFSPNGEWVGFDTIYKLKKIALSGGLPIELCDLAKVPLSGASWGSNGLIAFSDFFGLSIVSDSGGAPADLIPYDPMVRFSSPFMLPDGQTVLITVAGSNHNWSASHIDAFNLITKKRKTLLPNAVDARYSPTGHLVFARNASLWAVPFDANRLEVSSTPVPLLDKIMQSINAPNPLVDNGMGQFALSTAGTLVYASGSGYPTLTSTLSLVDSKGERTKVEEIEGDPIGLRVSSSGSRVIAFNKLREGSSSDILMYTIPSSGVSARLTITGDASWPLFLPDGKSISFQEYKNPGIYSLSLIAANEPQRIIESQPGMVAASWSLDGKWLAYIRDIEIGTAPRISQIFVRPILNFMPDSGEPRRFAPSNSPQIEAEFSPDSHWIAYVSNESGTNEVYVALFPGPGGKHRISTNGGSNLAWSRNGQELFYLGPDPGASTISMMAVDFSTAGEFKKNIPRRLFEWPSGTTFPLRSYDVMPDGRFVMSQLMKPPDQPVTKLNVVLGWAEELKRRVPTGHARP